MNAKVKCTTEFVIQITMTSMAYQVQEIFTEECGMFVYDDSSRTFWFNSNSDKSKDTFQLMGIILGAAIYNSVILNVHFPLALYKRLLGLELSLKDLAGAMPELARGLQQMLDFEGDVESTFCTTFSVRNQLAYACFHLFDSFWENYGLVVPKADYADACVGRWITCIMMKCRPMS